ncbi:MAG TPA: transglutaminase domain-containing protein, partial [Propionibacterium sp.]|nr:transglutaminase domain-containing protein [Propionibacterium sp.]
PITPILAALVAITLVGGIAAVAGPMLPGGTRHVLRERAEPPLDLHDYASPVTNFRHWKVDRTEDTLFTITGLPEGERLRLATLDTFDGIVFNVERDSAAFVRAGDRIDGADAGRLVALDVSVGEYAGVWLPGVGDWREIEFTGPGASGQADTLYHSHSTSTALTKAGVASGDTFRMTGDLVTSTDRAELKDARTAPDRLPAPSLVPEIVGETAEDLAGDGTTIERLTRMETQLKDGFYSDGRDGKSRAGHTAERISTMLSSPTLIGDDEQYAVTMALMARSLGYPARVVLGFYPEDPAVTSGAWEVRGGDAHVWVEVDFGQHGWVTFDPTPDSDRVPTTEVPRPLPKPDPQVPPPPLPPPHDGEEDPMVNSTDRAIGDRKDLATLFAVLRIIGTVVGIAAAAAAPFLLIAYAKRHRRTRRRRAPRTADSASGSWDELIDTAIDHGNRPPANGTRVEEAKALAAAYPTLSLLDTARRIDDQVYGPLSPPAEAVDQTWQRTADLTAQLKRAHPPLQRFVGFCSLRSFWAGRGVQRSKPELPRPAQTQAAT